jgi:hypothetical protein
VTETKQQLTGALTPSEHRRLTRREIDAKQYVAKVKDDVNRRLGLSPSRFGRAGRKGSVTPRSASS